MPVNRDRLLYGGRAVTALWGVLGKVACPYLLLAACGDGVQANSGLDALMQVTGAQFYRGTAPMSSGGPQVGSMRTLNQQLRVGQTQRDLSGSVDPTAAAVAVQLDGDLGYWVKPVGGAD